MLEFLPRRLTSIDYDDRYARNTDFDFICVVFYSFKSKRAIGRDPNAVLAGAVSAKFLQPVTGGSAQIPQTCCRVEYYKFPARRSLKRCCPTPRNRALPQPLSVPVSKATDHCERLTPDVIMLQLNPRAWPPMFLAISQAST
jgi:hypothetical protein